MAETTTGAVKRTTQTPTNRDALLFDFGVDSFKLGIEHTNYLDEVIRFLEDSGREPMTVSIDGFASHTGTAAHNLTLSENREQAVENYLKAHSSVFDPGQPHKIERNFKGFSNSPPGENPMFRSVRVVVHKPGVVPPPLPVPPQPVPPPVLGHSYDLGDGSRIELLLTPSFKEVAGKAIPEVPSPAFPDIKGILLPFPRQSGPVETRDTTMSAKAEFILRASHGDYFVGFKQLAFIKFHASLFAGFRESEGSIDEGTTGVNQEWLLDCEFDQVGSILKAVGVPFYVAPVVPRHGIKLEIEMKDQPGGGGIPLQRRNKKRDRLNQLLEHAESVEFATFVVVARPDGKHIPVEGFSWEYKRTIEMNWTNGNPIIFTDSGSQKLIQKFLEIKPGDKRFDLLTNPSLKEEDTVDFRVNRGVVRVGRGDTSPDYSLEEFEGYSEEVKEDMRKRAKLEFN